jgi:peptidylprolyl isomerase
MAGTVKEIEVTVAEVVDYLRVTEQFLPAVREVVERKITAQAARKSGITVTTNELQRAADAFRAVKDLGKARDTQRWLNSIGISIEAFQEYLETNILISKFKDRLEKKANRTKYCAHPGIQESIRDMAYQDWLKSQVK